jgi:hypothetical protein
MNRDLFPGRIPRWIWPLGWGLVAWMAALSRVGFPCTYSSNQTCAAFVDWLYGPAQFLWPVWYHFWDLLGIAGGVLFILCLTLPAGTLVGFTVLGGRPRFAK